MYRSSRLQWSLMCFAAVFAMACGGTTHSAPCGSDASWCNFANGSAPRLYHSAVWTGSELLVWGGLDGGYEEPGSRARGTGLRIEPRSGDVRPMNAVGAPSARHSHFATWTGKEMIVWGGQAGTGGVSERATGGGVYDPSADSWRPLTEPDGATRTAAAVTWTGDSLWVWGGSQGGELVRSGFLYQPASGESRVIATDVQEAAVNDADAVATNGVVLLTGGKTNFPDAHPLIYELATDAWRPAAPPPVPGTDGIGPPAFAHDGVAFVCNATQAACGGYSPEEDSWQTLELPPLEASFTYWPAWAITDRELVLFGLAGDGSTSDESIASALDMKTRTWSALPNDGAPSPRRGQSATWAGSSVLFWGGQVVDGPDPEQGWELKRP